MACRPPRLHAGGRSAPGWTDSHSTCTIESADDVIDSIIQRQYLRAARALLGWPLHKLAERSRLSLSTLRRLEDDVEAASEHSRMMAAAALREGGVHFVQVNGHVVGVVLVVDLVAARYKP